MSARLPPGCAERWTRTFANNREIHVRRWPNGENAIRLVHRSDKIDDARWMVSLYNPSGVHLFGDGKALALPASIVTAEAAQHEADSALVKAGYAVTDPTPKV